MIVVCGFFFFCFGFVILFVFDFVCVLSFLVGGFGLGLGRFRVMRGPKHINLTLCFFPFCFLFFWGGVLFLLLGQQNNTNKKKTKENTKNACIFQSLGHLGGELWHEKSQREKNKAKTNK